MPIFQSAKSISEKALRQIGAFPASMAQADEGELRIALETLEMLLNYHIGIRPIAGSFQIIEIPIEAGIGDYILSDYADGAEVSSVFSVCLVRNDDCVDPLPIEYESDTIKESLTKTGQPKRIYISTDRIPVLRVFPTPTQEVQDAGAVLRVRIQTYHPEIAPTGTGDTDLILRPSWNLWLTKNLAYELGLGPVRRLAEAELTRLKNNADTMESLLLSSDARNGQPSPPVTEPMPGMV